MVDPTTYKRKVKTMKKSAADERDQQVFHLGFSAACSAKITDILLNIGAAQQVVTEAPTDEEKEALTRKLWDTVAEYTEDDEKGKVMLETVSQMGRYYLSMLKDALQRRQDLKEKWLENQRKEVEENQKMLDRVKAMVNAWPCSVPWPV